MPSPDLTAYTELVLYDKTPAELVERALLDAAVKMPGWQPVDGNTELVLMEALSLVVAEDVYAINRVVGAVVETVLKMYGVERDLGTAPTATVTFTLTAPTGYDIPAGTLFRLDVGDGTTLAFALDGAVAVPALATTATGSVTAITPTAAANGIGTGTPLALITPVAYLDAVHLASPVSAGADPEDDTTWRDRGIQRLARLVSTLVTPKHFSDYALEDPLVYRAIGLDNYDGTGANTSSDAGHMTVAVAGSGGALLTGPQKTALAAEMDALAQANVAVHVIDPTITPVDVTTQVKGLPGYTSATVIANVTAALNAYLSPDTWEWGATVHHNELIAVIAGAAGVDYVDTLTLPAADAALAGAAPLADLGTPSITVL